MNRFFLKKEDILAILNSNDCAGSMMISSMSPMLIETVNVTELPKNNVK